MGNVAGGSLFAACQSLGVAGPPGMAVGAVLGAGVLIGAAVKASWKGSSRSSSEKSQSKIEMANLRHHGLDPLTEAEKDDLEHLFGIGWRPMLLKTKL
jgi:hypothetical protein